MCRIWGISYGKNGPEGEDWTPSELAQIMFPSLIQRGPHAWGWMSWDGEAIDSHKFPGRCDQHEAMQRMDIDPNAKWIIGHTRWATHGSPADNRNNHPLRHGKFMGVHNGVLRNHEEILAVTGREDPKTEVDSEAIFAALHRWGHRAGLSKIYGDMVAVYTDLEKPRTVHIAKSYGRPLLIGTTEAGSLIWASELQALEATGMKLSNVFELSTNHLLRVREGRVMERVQYRTTPTKPKKRVTVTANTKGRFSASGTRSAMRMAAQGEISEAERFIERERAKSTKRAKARQSMKGPVETIRKRKGDLEWGDERHTKRGPEYYVGDGKWVSEREFISTVLDEMDWNP